MRWNLRLAAAHRGIWKASELQRKLADAGLVISAGKMSGLWSGSPASIKLDDLDVLCSVLGCGVEELLMAEPIEATATTEEQSDDRQAAASPGSAPSPGRAGAQVTPKRRDGRVLPPA